MCGRFNLRRAPAEIARIFKTAGVPPNFPPRYNLAPTEQALVVRYNPQDGQRHLTPLRWGLIPSWARDKNIGARTINARADSVETKPAFRKAFEKRRCLIPADGFYEWQVIDAEAKTKQAYAIEPGGGGMFAFAGLWEGWRDPEQGGEILRTFTIITTEANALLRPIHERMPVILPETRWPQWLGETEAARDELRAMLTSALPEAMRLYPISTRVNSVKNDDAAILEPVSA